MYDPNKVEEEILKFWKENKIFQKLVEKNKGNKKIFRFIDGPITANNPMGVHHAYGRALKDIYQRYKAMKGYDQRFQNGFDCHGLPVEVEVEKQLDLHTKDDIEDYGFEKFIQKCKERVKKMSKRLTKQSIRLGQWMDWDNSYYTMSDNNIVHIWHFLKKCHQNGWIKKGKKVLPWCVRCGTSLSQHEVSEGYKELTHDAVFLKFPIKNRENEYLLVWTTTPWTLTSNVAAAVGPDVTYVKMKKNGEIFYLSKATSDLIEDEEILEELKGEDITGWEYQGPYDQLEAQKEVTHKVIPWEEVGEEDGTGIVHIAPGCGAEDFELGKELNLPAIAPLDENGNYIEGFDWLTGKNVKEVKEPILKDLEKRNILYKKESITHRYPTCWRCKEELVFRLTDAWFIDVEDIRSKLMNKIKEVSWSPEHGEKLMEDWLENMEDWNISRKRYWGLPLPFWECECGHLEVIGSIEELKKKAISGMDQLKELHRPMIDKVKIKCPKCGKEMERVKEVGDCWLDAGIVPYSTIHYLNDKKYWKKWFPAEMVCEMREQVRLWFYSILFMSVTLEDKPPYENVLMFEKVYDEEGKEMHKSGENVIWFDEAIEKMGADVMRWIYAKTNLNQNVLFGFGPGKENRKNLDYLVNIKKYIETFLDKPKKELGELKNEDKWILSRLESVKKIVEKSLENYNPYVAARELERFFINDFSRTYIQIIRSRIKEDEKNKIASIIYYVLLDTLKMMSPFTPFLTEYIYQDFYKEYEEKESIHLFDWTKPKKEKIDKKLEEDFKIINSIIESANSLRQEKEIGLRYPIKKIIISGGEEVKKSVEKLEKILKEMTNVKEIEFGKISLDYEVKLNYPKVGPKYGKDVKEIEKLLSEKDHNKLVKKLEETGSIKIGDFELGEEDLVVESKSQEGEEFKVEKISGVVSLDTEETQEIFEESLIKELIRNVQQTRKDKRLVVEQRIKLRLEANKKTKEIIEKWKDKIKKQVGAKKVIFKKIKDGKESKYKDNKIKFDIEIMNK